MAEYAPTRRTSTRPGSCSTATRGRITQAGLQQASLGARSSGSLRGGFDSPRGPVQTAVNGCHGSVGDARPSGALDARRGPARKRRREEPHGRGHLDDRRSGAARLLRPLLRGAVHRPRPRADEAAAEQGAAPRQPHGLQHEVGDRGGRVRSPRAHAGRRHGALRPRRGRSRGREGLPQDRRRHPSARLGRLPDVEAREQGRGRGPDAGPSRDRLGALRDLRRPDWRGR